MVLFQADNKHDPIHMSITEKRKGKKVGGANFHQKGKAAAKRTYVNVNIPKTVTGTENQNLFRDLSLIVHSADRYPNKAGDNRFADPDNLPSEEAAKVLKAADNNLAVIKTLVDSGKYYDRDGKLVDNPKFNKKRVIIGNPPFGRQPPPPPPPPLPPPLPPPFTQKWRRAEPLQIYVGRGESIEKLSGGKMESKSIQQFLDASYADKGKADQNIDGYDRDNSLSGERVSVYYNPTTKKAVIIHRGSKSVADWGNNLKMALGWKMSATNRFKHSKKIQEKVEAKYGKKNVITLGHSLGGKIASDVGGKSDEIITLNKATGIGWDAYKKDLGSKKNETNIRTVLDPVSIKGALDADFTIPSRSLNPITEHGTGVLERVDEEIGKGRADLSRTFLRKSYEKLTKKQLKTIIKALPKIRDNFKLTGAVKPVLIDYLEKRCGK